jgi:hypothetical protein
VTLADCGHPVLWSSYSPKTVKVIFTIPEEEYSGTVQVKLIYQTIQKSELQRQYQSYGHLIDFFFFYLAFKYFDLDRTWMKVAPETHGAH